MQQMSGNHLFVTANLLVMAVTILPAYALQSFRMDGLSSYAERPIAFLLRYVRRRTLAHAAILAAVLGAVGCSVSTQYGVKFLVDTLSAGPRGDAVWLAFAVLVSLIAADNLLWRLAGWIASHAFVGVTGDLRSELFRHLTGHAPSYFAERLSGTLTGRITATSNAVFAVENLFIWNVLPPCVGDLRRDRLPGGGQPADGDGAAGDRHRSSCFCCSGWPRAARRCITASPTGPRAVEANWPT